MSDEEKKAIEDLKKLKQGLNILNNSFFITKDEVDVIAIETILNLIKKQSKEIEELKDKNKSLENELIVYKIYTKQDDLKDFDLFLKQNYVSKKESEQKERKAYIKGTNDAHELCNKKWEDKIKAKIDEVCESTIEESNVDILYSLLEKE